MSPMLLLTDVINLSLLLEFLYWYIDTIFNVGESSSSFFSRHIQSVRHLSDVRPWASSSIFLSFRPFVSVPSMSILRMVLSILQGRLPRYIIHWWDFNRIHWFRKAFSFLEIIFQFFLLSPLLWWCLLPIFPSTCFPFSPSVLMHSWFWLFYSCCYFSFPNFHFEYSTFFNAKYHSYILTVCIRVTSCFSFWGNTLISSIYIGD